MTELQSMSERAVAVVQAVERGAKLPVHHFSRWWPCMLRSGRFLRYEMQHTPASGATLHW